MCQAPVDSTDLADIARCQSLNYKSFKNNTRLMFLIKD